MNDAGGGATDAHKDRASRRGGSRNRVATAEEPPATGAAVPLPAGVLHTAYERMIAHGLDVGPYTRLAETFRDLIVGRPTPESPRPPTFADGVADMEVLDAIRRSAAEQACITVNTGAASK